MDSLSRLLRENNPFVDSPLSERAMSDMDDIIAGRRRPRRDIETPPTKQRYAPTLLAVASFGVVAVLVTLVLIVANRPQTAMAVTPVPLDLRSTTSTVETLREALMKSHQRPQPAITQRGAEWEGWFLQFDADQPAASFIQPQLVKVTWDADFSGTSTIIAGEVLAADGTSLTVIPTTAAQPGVILYEERWGPGEYLVPLPETPPETTSGMREYLDAFLELYGFAGSSVRSAAEYLYAVTAVMQLWTLSSAAQAAAIEVILAAPGVDVSGATTDRAGRDGIVLELATTELDIGYRSLLVIDSHEWRLLAVERMTTDGLLDFHVPAGSVTDYTLWR